MARTLEDAIRDTLGNQLLRIVQLETENEALTERIAALAPTPAGPAPETPDAGV